MLEDMLSRKIYILGSGAIGGFVGGRLTQRFGKEHITLIDTDTEHVTAVRNMGLRIYDAGRRETEFETIEVEITTPEHIDKGGLDNVILATKSYSNGHALEGLSKDVRMLVLQNGYDRRIEEFDRAARGVEFGFACKVQEPGYIYNAVRGKYVLGGCGGFKDGLDDWAELLNQAQIKAQMRDGIEGYLWSKLLINSALNPVSAIKGFSFRKLIDTAESRELFKELYMEGYPIAKRKVDELGQKLGSFIGPPEIVNWIFTRRRLSDTVLKRVADKFGQVESSMLQDVMNKRQTEVDYINGAIIELGEEYGIATPRNEWIYHEVKKLEWQFVKDAASVRV